MSLFTSLSNRKGLFLLLALLVAFPLAWAYTLWGDPSNRLSGELLKVKHEWARAMRQESPQVTVISGGSSSLFQVDADLLHREQGLHFVHAGMFASMGMSGTVAVASTFLEPGDRLILMTEPALMNVSSTELPPGGAQVLLLTGDRDRAFFPEKEGTPSLIDCLLVCRPGVAHSVILAGKLMLRRPLHRYGIEDARKDGSMETAVRLPMPANDYVTEHHLSDATKAYLQALKEWAASRDVEVAYVMPVSYTSPGCAEAQRAVNRAFLDEVEAIIPVWRDRYLGVSSRAEDFADTGLHFTSTAAAERSREIARVYAEKVTAASLSQPDPERLGSLGRGEVGEPRLAVKVASEAVGAQGKSGDRLKVLSAEAGAVR